MRRAAEKNTGNMKMSASLSSLPENKASPLTKEMTERFKKISLAFLSERNKCLVILPEHAREIFFDWVESISTELGVSPHPIYDGYATFPEGYFGVRITDTEECINRLFTESGLKNSGIPYIICHDPKSNPSIPNIQPDAPPLPCP